MASSRSKGNISPFMVFIGTIVTFFIIYELFVLMITNTKKYTNPVVASKVTVGALYDRNGKALALEIPTYIICYKKQSEDLDIAVQVLSNYLDLTPTEIYNNIKPNKNEEYSVLVSGLDSWKVNEILEAFKNEKIESDLAIDKEMVISYPYAFHGAQIINEAMKVFSSLLSPRPGFNESITYGNDVYLTLDMDIQYYLDIGIQELYSYLNPTYSTGIILDLRSGEVLASTTYPFYDLNDATGISDFQKTNRTLLSSYNNLVPKLFLKACVYGSDKIIEVDENEFNFEKDFPEILNSFNNPSDNNGYVCYIPKENPKYMIFLSAINSEYSDNSDIFNNVVQIIESGLFSQGKL